MMCDCDLYFTISPWGFCSKILNSITTMGECVNVKSSSYSAYDV